MKSFLYLTLIIACLASTSFLSKENSQTTLIEHSFKEGSKKFGNQIQNFIESLEGYKDKKSTIKNLRNDFKMMRFAYKEIAYLAEYLDPNYIKDHVNGAPLPKLEEGLTIPVIIEPEGLQVIEELLYVTDSISNIDQLLLMSKKLSVHWKKKQAFLDIKLMDHQIFEASRIELVRLATLGITGFETPGSNNALAEVEIAMKTIHQSISVYAKRIAERNVVLQRKIEKTFQDAEHRLKNHKDFDNFDRYSFIKDNINPLFEMLLEAHLALNLPTWDITSPGRKSINYFSRNIFDPNFLNRQYYVKGPDQKFNSDTKKLGKLLFYDPILSSNNKRSCASCHNPQKAFTDGAAKSLALNSQGTVNRNAPSLINVIYSDKYFYDLRTDFLEDQIEHVILNEKEFHTDYPSIIAKISKSEEYMDMFRKCFPELKEHPLNQYSIATSITAYVSELNALNSPFDKMIRNEIADDHEVIRGFNLFTGKAACATCHFAPVFNGTVPPMYQESESEVLGVPFSKIKQNLLLDTDQGRSNGKSIDRSGIYNNSFKTVSLRNIALTAPYMHNGVFDTLLEVVEFYNDGGGAGLNFNIPNQTLSPDKLQLTKSEMQDLVMFMTSLTDTTGTTGIPEKLPTCQNMPELNNRKVGGIY